MILQIDTIGAIVFYRKSVVFVLYLCKRQVDLSNIKIAKQIPFKVLVKRVFKRIFPSFRIDYSEQEFRRYSSNYTLNSLIDIQGLIPNLNEELLAHYLNHEFNLLGSGWINRNAKNKLELGAQHFFYAQKLLKYLPKEYQFIDWQLDIKSGFRFNVKKQFDDQTISEGKNADIKNCWEIGRLQHFPQMALMAINCKNKSEILLEFKNQSLDFIISNPIGMGVQWACAMDVGIRLSNWLVAFDLFKQLDDEHFLDEKFTLLFTDYVHCHLKFIMNHLESKEGAAGNHYLFNLVGVLFGTNYLSEKEESIKWRKFAEQEIQKEFLKQFFMDGGNFEGSTTYHCLSSEAILYATALMIGRGSKLSSDYISLLQKSFQFIKDVVKPNGEMPQFGDNDSGRLFVYDVLFNKKENRFNLLNYESLIRAFEGLYGSENEEGLSPRIIKNLSHNNPLRKDFKREETNIPLRRIPAQKYTKNSEIIFDNPIDLTGVKLYAYDQFGLYVFKSASFYLAISAISNKNMHHSWGHVHNDKLSFELQVDGEDLVKDPGTYSYSAFPDKRHKYRSAEAHSSILIDGVDQNKSIGLFYLERESACTILDVKGLSITLQAKYYGVNHIRKFEISEKSLKVVDFCNKEFRVNINKFSEYAPNYGINEVLNS